MKTTPTIIFTLLLLAGMLLAGCKDDPSNAVSPATGSEIVFSIGIGQPGQSVKSGFTTKAATDKDFITTWDDGDAIGLFAVSHAPGQPAALAASGNYIHNVKLTYNKTANTWTPATPLYFTAEANRQLDFYAYYPYDAGATNPTAIAFAVQSDQSGAGFNASHLMSATATNVDKGAVATLIFAHLLALVEVDISESSDNMPPYDAGKLKVSLCGVHPSAALNLSAGSATAAGATAAIPMHRVEMGDAGRYVYRAIVPAQDLVAGHQLFAFRQDLNDNNSYADGNDFSLTYTIPQAKTLTPAKACRYKIKMVDNAVPDPNHVYAPGDYYPHVGRVVGVVYKVNPGGKTGLMVGLNEVSRNWGEGQTWAAAQTAGGRTWRCPNCPDGVEGELVELCQQKTVVSAALDKLSGADKMNVDEVYWSSTSVDGSDNYAYIIIFGNCGNLNCMSDKGNSRRVRPISNF